MKGTKEYGEYFPISMSPFGYNETIAQDFFPLTKEETLAKGYKWKDENHEKAALPSEHNFQNCIECKNAFRVIPKEAELYKKIGVQMSPRCWDCRRKKLLKWKS